MGLKIENKWRTLLFAAVFCLAVVIVYTNTFHAPFVYDDINYITKNDPNVHMTEFSWDQLKTAALKGKPKNRPLANISFALNYYFGEENPFGYHVLNLIIHLATGILLFFLIRTTILLAASLKPQEAGLTSVAAGWMAFLAVLIWLVHPVQTNAVTYIVQRMTSLAALFYILSLVLYIRGRLAIRNRGRIKASLYFGGCAVAAVCAVFTKQNAGMLPVFILVYEWFFFQDLRPIRSKRLIFAGLAAILVFCVIGYIYLGGDPLERILSAYQRREFTLPQRVLTELRVVAYYAGLMIFPQSNRLLLDHDYPLSDSLTAPLTTALCAIMILGILLAALYSARRHRFAAFCLIWFLGNLVIESSVIGIEIIYEHRLYLPSMMICGMAVYLLSHRLKRQHLVLPVVVAIALVFAFWTYQRNQIWASDVTFWQDVVKKAPKKARPLQNLAYSLQQNGRYAAAITYYQASLDIEAHPAVYYNLGLAFMYEKRYVEAVDAYMHALQMNYQPAGIYKNFAFALASAGEFRAAVNQYRNALKRNPKDDTVRKNLKELRGFLDNCQAPLVCLSQRIDQQPDNLALRFKRGITYEKQEMLEAAIRDYQYVISELAASDRKLYLLTLNRLAMAYFRTGRINDAKNLCAKGIRLAPEMYYFYYHLAALEARDGNAGRSLDLLRSAIENGFSDLAQLRQDRRFDNIRGRAAFRQLAASIKQK